MNQTTTGMQAMFPLYLSRRPRAGEDALAADSAIAQNENNLNQNFATLYNKIMELENALYALSALKEESQV